MRGVDIDQLLRAVLMLGGGAILVVIGLHVLQARSPPVCTADQAKGAEQRLPIDFHGLDHWVHLVADGDSAPVSVNDAMREVIHFGAWAVDYKESPDWECRRWLYRHWAGLLIARGDTLHMDIPDIERHMARDY